MSEASESHVRDTLTVAGFELSKIPEGNGRSADFLVKDSGHSYHVEVTERVPEQAFLDYEHTLGTKGIATLSRRMERDAHFEGTVDNKAGQLRQTKTPADFRVLWVTVLRDYGAHVAEQWMRTLYGAADLLRVPEFPGDNIEPGPSIFLCLYYYGSPFALHTDLQAVVVSARNALWLHVNDLSPEAPAFRRSPFFQDICPERHRVDPLVLAASNSVLSLDPAAPQDTDTARYQAIRKKYGIATQPMSDRCFWWTIGIDP